MFVGRREKTRRNENPKQGHKHPQTPPQKNPRWPPNVEAECSERSKMGQGKKKSRKQVHHPSSSPSSSSSSSKRTSNVDSVDKHGWTPLMWACMEGDLEETRRLIKEGAQIDRTCKDGSTPLMIACQSNHETVARFLVDAAYVLESKNKDVDEEIPSIDHFSFADIKSIVLGEF